MLHPGAFCIPGIRVASCLSTRSTAASYHWIRDQTRRDMMASPKPCLRADGRGRAHARLVSACALCKPAVKSLPQPFSALALSFNRGICSASSRSQDSSLPAMVTLFSTSCCPLSSTLHVVDDATSMRLSVYRMSLLHAITHCLVHFIRESGLPKL